ncbi:MAG: ABC transporter permease [Bacteroidales bacterium]|nr:ABC transporter permease [Candidatus Latescibacterota bacterium]
MNRFLLIFSYLKIGFRYLRKDKGFAFTNVVGLTIGMTLCLLIVIGLMWEMSYDKFHENADRLYRVTGYEVEHDNHLTRTVAPVGPVLKSDYPEIVETARYTGIGELLFQNGDRSFYESAVAADRSLFDICSFPIIAGDRETVLTETNTILIDETTAEKLFGETDPVGKTILMDSDHHLTVCGVFEDIPDASTYRFSAVLPWSFLDNVEGFQEDRWEDHSIYTFVLLGENAVEEDVEAKIINVFNDNNDEYRVDLALQSFNDIHLNANINGPSFFFVIFMFTFIGLFILLISCINFVNLSTARSSFRFKEIGVRKVIGGTRNDIILQFFGESFIVVFVSFILSLTLTKIALDAFHNATGKYFSLNVLNNPTLLLFMLGILLFTGLAAGCYPALHLSSFAPSDVIKGSHQTGKKSQRFRRVLVTTQFTASIIFIIFAMVSTRQAEYIFDYDKGWNSENIVHIPLRSDNRAEYEILKSELIENPQIENVTAGYFLPTNYSNTSGVIWPGKDPQKTQYVAFNLVDFDYAETFKIEMARGRSFSKDEMDGPASYIINETLARMIGTEPILGSEITVWDNPGRVVGVTKDFNYRTLKIGVDPMVMMLRDETAMNHMIVRLDPGYDGSTLEYISATWKDVLPNIPYEYSFIDDDIYSQYNDEDIMGKFMKGISIAALFMTCSGLVGLITFMTERKKKEIGLRKIHGASATQIVRLISKEFLVLVTISNVIAWPIAYLMIKAYLESYAVRTHIGMGAFIFAGVTTILIAFLTISYRSIKAAHANPVEALRYE